MSYQHQSMELKWTGVTNQLLVMFSFNSFLYSSCSTSNKFLDLSEKTKILLLFLICSMSFSSFPWKLLHICVNSTPFIISCNSFPKSVISWIAGGHLTDLRLYLSKLLLLSFPRNSRHFHLILFFDTFSVFDINCILYWCFGGIGIFLTE